MPDEKSPLGVPKGTVFLSAYHQIWPGLFEEEKQLLLKLLGEDILEVAHIGSTAVPGLAAKPIIDVAAAVEDLAVVKGFIEPLSREDYEYKGEYGLPGRLLFVKGAPRNTHHLHVVEQLSEHWRVWLAFRDYLREHPAEVEHYAAFKKDLAKRYKDDRPAYTRGKSDYVAEVLKKAGG